MAETSIFRRIEERARAQGLERGTKAASDWFFKKIGDMRPGRLQPNRILTDEALERASKPLIGRMYFFKYDPKLKEELPYYDTFPLIFMVGPAKGGFHGINLHYLPPILRAELFDQLIKITNNKRFDETTRLRATYDLLNGSRRYRAFEPCFHHYLAKQMRSKPVLVPAEQWEIAMLLPAYKFKKARTNKIWMDSKRSIRRNT